MLQQLQYGSARRRKPVRFEDVVSSTSGAQNVIWEKIGLFACTGIVAGNMMGSGIALLPSNLASIGSVALFGWLIAMFGALALAYVYARLSTVNPQSGGPVAYAGEISPAFGYQTGVLY